MKHGLTTTLLWTSSLALALLPARAGAEVALPPVLSSRMVLQRDMLVPIWGTAKPGEKIAVKFRDQEKTTQADDSGKWLLKLGPLKAGGPDALTVKGENTLTLDDVLVGEVWVGSGQSNMADVVGNYATKGDDVLKKMAAGTHPKLRLMRSGQAGWAHADPESNAKYSALLFAFGMRLHESLDVPVGLILGAVGGTPSGRWLTGDMLVADESCRKADKRYAALYAAANKYEQLAKKHELDLVQWEKAVLQAKKDEKAPPVKPRPPTKPAPLGGGDCYLAHVKPFQPFAIRGVLWDQGEWGTGVGISVNQYLVMGALIRGWRLAWGQGDFPFIYIQKPSGLGCAWDYAGDRRLHATKFAPLPAAVPPLANGIFRETHIRIMNHPNTAMAITSDLCPGRHSLDKSGYATRASQVALGLAYGKKIQYYGPIYKEHKIEGDKIRVSFTHVGQGLAHKYGDKLQGFAIAGTDKNFVWADAAIDVDTVVLSSPMVPEPLAVRYAWSETHPWANLFNRDGLPALSFRTDAWEK